jgi:hypothetical protein
MILFPALWLGGHFLTAAVAQTPSQLPQLDYETNCRDSASQDLGVKDDHAICMQDEAAARAELTQKWRGFDAAGRATCTRLSTTNRTGSYVEMLTCLEMDRDARALRRSADLDIIAPERLPERESAGEPVRTGQVARPAAPRAPPVALTPDAKPARPNLPGWVFCPPGISALLPNCPHASALP